MPETDVPIHCHPNSTENVLCLCGKVDEVIYDAEGREVDCIRLCPSDGVMECIVPKGQWHTIVVHEPSVIYEGKDGKYGEDGTESFVACNHGAFGTRKDELKKQITYLIGKERADGNLTELSAIDISNLLHVPIEDVEQAMKEMDI